MVWFILLLVVNFAISWANSVSVGRMWSESKAIGGSLRTLAVAGYIMAVAGFTMVYGCVLVLLAPYILPLIPVFEHVSMSDLLSLTSDLLYILVATAIIPSGFIIWFNSVVRFWRNRTLANGLTAGWNSYAQIRNAVNAARHLPSAFGRITKAMFGGKGRRKGNAMLVLAVMFIVIMAVCGGWFTASALIKKADAEYDGFEGLDPQEEGAFSPRSE